MQVKERRPWEIPRDFLAQNDSTGLMMTEYLEPQATRRPRLGKSRAGESEVAVLAQPKKRPSEAVAREASGTRGVVRLWYAVERRQREQYGFAAGKEVLLECRRACSRLPP